MAAYFKFIIPDNADGSPVTFSPGWHGTIENCPRKVTVLMYNIPERYGIAYSEDVVVANPKLENMTKAAAEALVASKVSKTGEYADSVFKVADMAKIWEDKFPKVPEVK